MILQEFPPINRCFFSVNWWFCVHFTLYNILTILALHSSGYFYWNLSQKHLARFRLELQNQCLTACIVCASHPSTDWPWLPTRTATRQPLGQAILYGRRVMPCHIPRGTVHPSRHSSLLDPFIDGFQIVCKTMKCKPVNLNYIYQPHSQKWSVAFTCKCAASDSTLRC
jgi:hypothetical protein